MSTEELDNYILHKATLYEVYWIWNNLAFPDDCWIHHIIGTSCYKRIGDLKDTFHKNYESHFCRRVSNMQNWSIRQINKEEDGWVEFEPGKYNYDQFTANP